MGKRLPGTKMPVMDMTPVTSAPRDTNTRLLGLAGQLLYPKQKSKH